MKICNKCSAQNSADAQFCYCCGQKLTTDAQTQKQVRYCPVCGSPNDWDARFCTNCGANLQVQSHTGNENILDSATRKINGWTGENRKVKLNLAQLFSQVFKKHTQEEADEIFIAGTKTTTPSLQQVSTSPVTPWLYSRVLAATLLVVALLWTCSFVFENTYTLISLIFFSGFAIPVALLIFFFETNVYKNISIFEAVKTFIIGGALSLVSTMIMYTIFGSGNFSLLGALLIGLVEETGKLLIVLYYVNKKNYSHIFNGLLVGAAVGAGFAAFENVGYVAEYGLKIAILRSFTSIGSHAIWTGILGAAIVMIKRDRKFNGEMLLDHRFINFYLLVVILHGLWDADIFNNLIKLMALTVAGWVAILVLIHAGLREIKQIQHNLTEKEANENEEMS